MISPYAMREKIDRILCQLEALLDEISQLNESPRLEHTENLLRSSLDQLCMLYSEWEE
jgi:hypothetical protein